VEAVFRALADPSRRRLLDELFRNDGQTLTQLLAHLPSMTRFGVMKHLRILEDAGLMTTRKAGREKLHYLNPIPIRLVHDRWISKYAEPWVGAMGALKRDLEAENGTGAGALASKRKRAATTAATAPIRTQTRRTSRRTKEKT
jgi:DNA-binding transcriptional ArsR family regulator